MSFTPAPKPMKRSDRDKTVDKLVKAWGRQKRWRDRAIAKAKGKPRPKVRERNEKRIARKAKAYAAVIRSAFHKLLRYLAFQRSGGLCECDQCVAIRQGFVAFEGVVFTDQRIAHAFTPIPCWFTKGGSEPHLRFRSTDGELHHGSYKFFGEENLAELAFVQWTWKSCHQRIEAEHGTRRRFLMGAR